jgi:hypothetical protein
MENASQIQPEDKPLLPRYFVCAVAFVSAIAMAAIATLGPLVLGSIHYKTSQSGIWQAQGGDFANLVLAVPLLLIGGVLLALKRDGAKYFLILPPLTLIYTGLSLGIGNEWSNPAYTGNVEQYWWLYLTVIIGGLLLLIASMSMFTPKDAPQFKTRNLRIYVLIMSLLLLVFAAMWISETMQVASTGDTSSGSYKETPTIFWVVRYLDLGGTIPLGFLALYLLLSNPRKAYSMILLFYGFFVTMGTSVNAMGWVMWLNDDPTLQPGALVLFSGLMLMAYAGLLYVIKDKLRSPFKK